MGIGSIIKKWWNGTPQKPQQPTPQQPAKPEEKPQDGPTIGKRDHSKGSALDTCA
jgi:hypothetical protein